jgi:hypothetical protein
VARRLLFDPAMKTLSRHEDVNVADLLSASPSDTDYTTIARQPPAGMPVGMGQPVEHAPKGGGFWDAAGSAMLEGLESWCGF